VRGLFVTGTDTGVGKTILSAALLAAMAADGEAVRAFKPVVTGLEEAPAGGEGAWPSGAAGVSPSGALGSWPADPELLGAAAGMPPEEVAPLRFGPAVSPHLAAGLAGERIDPPQLLAHARAAAESHTLVAEGVGGLLVPLTASYSVCDLAVDLGLGVLIAARPGLGTINHTLLTLKAARAAGLDVRAVVITPWPAAPSAMEHSNAETIEQLGDVEVALLAEVGAPCADALAVAGAVLPWRRWLSRG
jgi:dethiobiotin synthetase